jgi:hypothetical protein
MTLAIQTFSIGQRVRTTEIVDNFPTIVVERGETGTVMSADQEGFDARYMVRMDRVFPALAEWDNCLEVYVYAGDDVPLETIPTGALNADCPSCAVAIAEAIRAIAAEAGAQAGTRESDRLMAVLGTLQAILVQKGCGANEDQYLTRIMDEAIFG